MFDDGWGVRTKRLAFERENRMSTAMTATVQTVPIFQIAPRDSATDSHISYPKGDENSPVWEPLEKSPAVALLTDSGKATHAASMSPEALCQHIEIVFAPAKKALKENLPYLDEAHKRFSQPGRRIPVSGKPTWGEWIDTNLGISDRHVRRLLAQYRIETGQSAPTQSKPRCRRAKHAVVKTSASSSKADLGAEVRRKLVPTVETAERYIRVLEALVHSQAVTLTEEQRTTLQRPMEDWRSILRYARGVQAERAGKAVSSENAPAALEGVA